MAVYANFRTTVTDESGNVIPNAVVEVRRESSGSPLAVLYSDRAGTVPLGNPFTIGDDGVASFYVRGGVFYIRATSGSQERVWRHAAVGTAAEHDFVDLMGRGIVVRETLVDLELITPETEEDGGWVLNDPDPDADGIYYREGAAWVYGRAFPAAMVELVVTGGTINAVQAETEPGVDPVSAKVYFIRIDDANTDDVTISVNGQAAIPALDINGGQFDPGEFTGTLLLDNRGTELRALNNPGSEAAATAAAAAAAASAAAATGAASSVVSEQESAAYATANYHPSAPPSFIRVAGQDDPGDGGQGYYENALSGEPAHEGKFSITLNPSGTEWYELSPDQPLTPRHFGAVGDGATNDTAAFTDLEGFITGTVVNLLGRTYVVTAEPTGNEYRNGQFRISAVNYPVPSAGSVSWYNAVTEGGCDNTGATDTTNAILAALKRAHALKLRCYFPEGEYDHDDNRVRLDNTLDGLHIIGDGWTKSIMDRHNGDAISTHVWEIYGGADITIEGIGFRTDQTAHVTGYGQGALCVRNASHDIRILNCGGQGQFNHLLSIYNSKSVDVQKFKGFGYGNSLIRSVNDHHMNGYADMSDENFVNGTTATVTISNASPGVVTDTAHGIAANAPVKYTTTGALPSPLVAGTTYYVKTVLGVNTYTLSATPGGSVINTTTAGSGVHTRTKLLTYTNEDITIDNCRGSGTTDGMHGTARVVQPVDGAVGSTYGVICHTLNETRDLFTGLTVTNSRIRMTHSQGFSRGGKMRYAKIADCTAEGVGSVLSTNGWGFLSQKVNNEIDLWGSFVECHAVGCYNGFLIDESAYITFSACHATVCNKTGFYLESSIYCSFSTCLSDNNSENGFWADGTSLRNMFSACQGVANAGTGFLTAAGSSLNALAACGAAGNVTAQFNWTANGTGNIINGNSI